MTEYRVYTDGACDGAGLGGWAWVAVDPQGKRVNGRSGGERETTNNRMELRAVIDALTVAPPGVAIELVTDSAYVSNCFLERWYDKWRANGWVNSKRQPVENRDLWEELIALVEAHPGPLRWTHVRGHGKRATDDPEHVRWNAVVDELAVSERQAIALETDLRELERTDPEVGAAKVALDAAVDRLTNPDDYVRPENLSVDRPDELIFAVERMTPHDVRLDPDRLWYAYAVAAAAIQQRLEAEGYRTKHVATVTVRIEAHAERVDQDGDQSDKLEP